MKQFTQGIRDGIPIALGYLSVSFTFGLMAVGEGLAWWEATLMSMTNLTSAGQFAALPLMAAGGAWFEMFLTQFVINLRYALNPVIFTNAELWRPHAKVMRPILNGDQVDHSSTL